MKRNTNLQGLYFAVIALLVAAVIINFITGINFFKFTNLLNIARSFSMLGIASLGQTVVIISGGLDLSVAEVISTANVFAANFMEGKDVLFFPVTLFTLGFGASVGLFNGFLVTKRKVPPFIATLGTAIVVRGIRLMWTQGMPSGHIPENLNNLGVGTTLGIPNLFYVFIVFVIGISVVLNRMGYGRRLFAVGTNSSVSNLSGINSDRVIILSYIICSMSAAFVGILLGGYTGMSDQKIGEGYDIDTIAVSVLGGAAIGGGIGSVQGTVIGAVIMLMITNLSLLVQFPIQSQMMIKGFVIVLALALNARKRRSAV